ncbi:hypothetical protein BB559_000437 [Furculomyces boomerangus]|uniref:Uncharacterized protein n=2 Tax=Harpellales TaxID=61421 RepID=A0A2T9Z585_9FUNG|nr:hypothetical protein BB559_000437 [Furculomyces boomerangus]PVZ98344.1 hypothetical protein BB558_005652 [Smittium angustum]PWA02644.1 hypothetical protein BB558_001220 [Smittium angustum]
MKFGLTITLLATLVASQKGYGGGGDSGYNVDGDSNYGGNKEQAVYVTKTVLPKTKGKPFPAPVWKTVYKSKNDGPVTEIYMTTKTITPASCLPRPTITITACDPNVIYSAVPPVYVTSHQLTYGAQIYYQTSVESSSEPSSSSSEPSSSSSGASPSAPLRDLEMLRGLGGFSGNLVVVSDELAKKLQKSKKRGNADMNAEEIANLINF